MVAPIAMPATDSPPTAVTPERVERNPEFWRQARVGDQAIVVGNPDFFEASGFPPEDWIEAEQEMARWGLEGALIVGYDISERALERAAERLADSGLTNARFVDPRDARPAEMTQLVVQATQQS